MPDRENKAIDPSRSLSADLFLAAHNLQAGIGNMTYPYVDKFSQQWIVRDAGGNLWIVPSIDNAWDHRVPLYPTDETILEPYPGHYKYMFTRPK